MVILGFILIALGVLVILAEIFTGNGSGDFLGVDLNAETTFFLGLGAGVAILLGLWFAKFGAQRGLRHRRDQKQLDDLSERLERNQASHRGDYDEREDRTTL